MVRHEQLFQKLVNLIVSVINHWNDWYFHNEMKLEFMTLI